MWAPLFGPDMSWLIRTRELQVARKVAKAQARGRVFARVSRRDLRENHGAT